MTPEGYGDGREGGSDRGAARPARELLKKTVESANSFPCSPFAT
jgi:hypothetical protein